MMKEASWNPRGARAARGIAFSFLLPWETVMAQIFAPFLARDARDSPSGQPAAREIARARPVRAL